MTLKNPSRIVIRCDASPQIGTGHMMRCLALGQGLKSLECQVVFVFNNATDGIKQRIKKNGFHAVKINIEPGSEADAAELVKIAKDQKADWIITDGYYFGIDYQKHIKAAGFKLMTIDDLAESSFVSDIILNQNPGFDRKDYALEPYTRLLAGPQYVLLRSEFFTAEAITRPPSNKAKNILVTMGGADPDNLTGRILNVINGIPNLESAVLLGSANPNIETIRNKVSRSTRIIIDAQNVVPYMLQADLAVHAASTTSFELAYLGIPSICYILAKNQVRLAKELQRAGFSCNLGWHNEFSGDNLKGVIVRILNDSAQLEHMSKCGKSLVDGLGITRVVKEIRAKNMI